MNGGSAPFDRLRVNGEKNVFSIMDLLIMQTGMNLLNLMPGFSDPVLDSQRSFRDILYAMAYPGRPVALGVDLRVPGPLHQAAGAVCLTILDMETPLWTDLPEASVAVDWLRFHCGCPVVQDPSKAAFALITRGEFLTSLDPFNHGEDAFPEKSTTLIVQVSDLHSGSGSSSIRGPGIASFERLGIHGLKKEFWKAWRINHGLYPLGVDLLFSAGTTLVALPRTSEAGD
jgi:alpha-D-ribose 1-methylphosphonate 5-triphosphate synthase subunit PhnH